MMMEKCRKPFLGVFNVKFLDCPGGFTVLKVVIRCKLPQVPPSLLQYLQELHVVRIGNQHLLCAVFGVSWVELSLFLVLIAEEDQPFLLVSPAVQCMSGQVRAVAFFCLQGTINTNNTITNNIKNINSLNSPAEKCIF
jgi:hypothetical protein